MKMNEFHYNSRSLTCSTNRIVKALEKLRCTTYVIPLEKGLILNIFHEGVNELMTAIQKTEEIGILDTYSLQVPLTYSI